MEPQPTPQIEQQGTPAPQAPPKPGVPLGDSAPPIADLAFQLCPNCGTGVLQIVTYDPHATYEQAQDKAAAPERASGGSYGVHCGACDYSESRAFNPANTSGQPRQDGDYA